MAEGGWQYTTKKGDTLIGIAARFNVPGGWQTLWQYNKFKVKSGVPEILGVGELLFIPGQKPVPKPVTVIRPSPAPPVVVPVTPEPEPEPEESGGLGWLLLLGLGALAYVML